MVCASDLNFSNRHVTFESNRDVRFEFKSNLEASQVPSYRTTAVDGWLGFNGIFSTNRLNCAIKKKFVGDVYFRKVVKYLLFSRNID